MTAKGGCQIGHTSLEQTRTYCLSPVCLRKIWEVFNSLYSNFFKNSNQALFAAQSWELWGTWVQLICLCLPICFQSYLLEQCWRSTLSAPWFFPDLMSVVVHILGQKWAFEFRINCLKYCIGAFTPLSFLPTVWNKHCILNIWFDFFLICICFFLPLVLRVWLTNTWSTIMNKNTESEYPCLTAHFREILCFHSVECL